MNRPQIPDQVLVFIHRSVELWGTTVTGDGWGSAEWSDSARDALTCFRASVLSSGGWQTDIMPSCVSEVTSALQALEVGLLQDAVDLQIRHWVRRANQLWRLAGAKGTAGASSTLTATAPSCMFWTADAAAALTVRWLRVPGIPAWLRRERMTSALPFGLGHQVATLLITTTALSLPVFSQHMMTLNQSRRAFFVFCSDQSKGPGWLTLSTCSLFPVSQWPIASVKLTLPG